MAVIIFVENFRSFLSYLCSQVDRDKYWVAGVVRVYEWSLSFYVQNSW